MKMIIALAALVLSIGCTKTNPGLTPIQDIGCAAETTAASAMASSIVSALNCSNQNAIQTSLLTALGNINLCSTTSAAQSQTQGKVVAKGIIANIACPIIVPTIIGYATNSVPSGWGCTSGGSASSLSAALVTACELAPF